MKTPKTDAAEIEVCHVDDDGGGWIKAVPSIIARDFEMEVARLEKENQKMREAITRAISDSESGTGWGPDITVCDYLRMAAMPNESSSATGASETTKGNNGSQ